MIQVENTSGQKVPIGTDKVLVSNDKPYRIVLKSPGGKRVINLILKTVEDSRTIVKSEVADEGKTLNVFLINIPPDKGRNSKPLKISEDNDKSVFLDLGVEGVVEDQYVLEFKLYEVPKTR